MYFLNVLHTTLICSNRFRAFLATSIIASSFFFFFFCFFSSNFCIVEDKQEQPMKSSFNTLQCKVDEDDILRNI